MKRIYKFISFILIIGTILFGFNYSMNIIHNNSMQKEEDILLQSINNGLARCYAMEGQYPPNISYLKEHYGLYYNSDRFYIDYHPIGTNIIPDVTIIKKE